MVEIDKIQAGKYECARLGGGVEVFRNGADPKEVHGAAVLFSLRCKWINGNDSCIEEDECAVRELRLEAKELMENQRLSSQEKIINK